MCTKEILYSKQLKIKLIYVLLVLTTVPSFQIDTKLKGFELHYAGAPLELMYEDTSNLDGLLNEQYVLFDLAAPKHIGGVRTQGRKLVPFEDCPYRVFHHEPYSVRSGNSV